MNQIVEQENEDQNMHVTEPEPQGIADQVGEKKDQNVHAIQPKPQGLADEGERRGVGRRQTLLIRNGMDESEAGKKKKTMQPMWSRWSHLQEVP